ncbi:MAG: ATP-binding cassette domain-containing protein [Syntrophobacter sp.]
MLLESISITKRYGDDAILRDVCLRIEPGESVAITGVSGSGKSTLLSLLGLLLDPTEGELLFREKETSTLSDDEKARIRNCHFGFIFQNPQLIGSLSVLDNVLVPASLARKSHLRARAEIMLEDLGLKNRLKHLPSQLSIGQKRRVAIARALLLEPEVIFADEPTNDLDPGRAARIGDLLFDLPSKGKALVLVTHDPGLMRKASRTVRIGEGMVREFSQAGTF